MTLAKRHLCSGLKCRVWAFEVDGDFIRWCGTLEQFEADCRDYVDVSKGTFTKHSKYHVSFFDSEINDTVVFKAISSKLTKL